MRGGSFRLAFDHMPCAISHLLPLAAFAFLYDSCYFIVCVKLGAEGSRLLSSQRIDLRGLVFARMREEYVKEMSSMSEDSKHSFRAGLLCELWRFLGVWVYTGQEPVFDERMALRQELIRKLLTVATGASLSDEQRFRLLADFAAFVAQEAMTQQDRAVVALQQAAARRRQQGGGPPVISNGRR